jgi:prophage DNA circulation protein
MSSKTELDEINAIVRRTAANLLMFNGMRGQTGAALRQACGDLVARTSQYVTDGTFANRLLNCFRLATIAGMTLDWMDQVIAGLVNEKPTTLMVSSVVQNSLIMAIAQEGRIIAATEYTSRDDVDTTMQRMNNWFDIIKDMIADTMSGPGYEAFITLAGAITRHLTDSARPLPRMLRYDLASTMPGLLASQYIYGDGGRSEELAEENKVVHPLFMPRTLRALSA